MATFVPNLKVQGKLDDLHFTVCIVGSRKILQEDDYGSTGWELLAPNLTIYGFDADVDACEAANAELAERKINWKEKHIPIALGKSAGIQTLYVTGHPSCSSLYPPNEPYISRFIGFKDSMKPDFTVEIETTTLDEFCASERIEAVDFLQIDVQGADLDVLKGSAGLLQRGILGIQVEVEFSPLYLKQPLFTDIDLFLKSYGFGLFDLITTNYWCRVTRACSPIRSSLRPGQLTWADACYFLDPLQENSTRSTLNPNQILKLACLADILGFPDYALELLQHLTIKYGDDSQYNFAPAIVESLSQFPDLVEQGLHTLPIVASIQHRM